MCGFNRRFSKGIKESMFFNKASLFGKGGGEWLMSIELPEPDGVIMKNDEDCKLLKSIPGNGRITKNGNKWLRTAMVEAVIPAISSDMELKRYYERIRYNKGAKAAKVAAARRLLCIVYRVLKEKDTFKLNKRELRYKGVESPSISPSAVY
jgi:hypothetical protein